MDRREIRGVTRTFMPKKILIAEDEPDSRRLLEDILEAFGPHDIHVLIAHDGAETMEVTNRERPDLILLDIMMPKISGFDICRQIKQDPELASTYIIMITARFQVEDRREATRAGADEYITKPFDVIVIIERIRNALGITG
jgi:two-component system alkaline phosphatase synthesis response regulator PhoP